MRIFEPVLALLSCPDDGGMLACEYSKIRCTNCRREFQQRGDNTLDLLPSKPLSTPVGSANYVADYRREYGRALATCIPGRPWGALENPLEQPARKKKRQIESVLDLLKDPALPKAEILCDLSGGAGQYTLEYARHFKFVIHCDLSADSILWTARLALQQGLQNIFCVRADYLRSPFRASLERLICLDTLVRGWEHERALLVNVTGALRPDGVAVVDFHNWWHNPLRRIGLMRDNFSHNRSYSLHETRELLRQAGISGAQYFPYFQELPRWPGYSRAAALFLPPTRFIYRIRRHAN